MLKRTILSRSLVVAFAASAMSFAMLPAAYAQSTTGSIYGAVPPGTVVVISGANGITRTATA